MKLYAAQNNVSLIYVMGNVLLRLMEEELAIELCVHGYSTFATTFEKIPSECELRNMRNGYTVRTSFFMVLLHLRIH